MKLTASFTWQWDITSLSSVVPSHCQKSSEKYRVPKRICRCKMEVLLVFTQQGRLKAILFVCIFYGPHCLWHPLIECKGKTYFLRLWTNLRCDACLQGLAYTIFEGGTPIDNIVCISICKGNLTLDLAHQQFRGPNVKSIKPKRALYLASTVKSYS